MIITRQIPIFFLDLKVNQKRSRVICSYLGDLYIAAAKSATLLQSFMVTARTTERSASAGVTTSAVFLSSKQVFAMSSCRPWEGVLFNVLGHGGIELRAVLCEFFGQIRTKRVAWLGFVEDSKQRIDHYRPTRERGFASGKKGEGGSSMRTGVAVAANGISIFYHAHRNYSTELHMTTIFSVARSGHSMNSV